ncbi:Pimeloyl-ACP methyl ester carboxylesterase [Rhodoferax sp. OV413]|uniref:alpha/beta fold hydrolase n=1 Tax=Rhodoferax sp. OV413 TaxID=1855285 RepID=UPI000885F6C9|nr:alpha/beta hydrolase [Rhodoferax sp. OV413]SDO70092.1 Pimeloyl-ACP methyl ester carboxylesterase [Rhodoferax sp. OV413]
MNSLNSPTRRRSFLGSAALSLAIAPIGSLLATSARAATSDGATRFESLKTINAGDLRVEYAEAGPANGPVAILLHGWPYDIHAFVDVAPRLAAAGYRVIVPYLRGYGGTRFLSADSFRNGQQGAVAQDIIALMDALGIRQAVLGAFDWGARTACIIAAIWPERVAGLVSVSGYLIGNPQANAKPQSPAAEFAWWYQSYLATDRGRDGYAANPAAFNRFIWQQASPKWQFDDATYLRSAQSFDNPDHVAIVVHNYRWRIALVQGESRFDALEARLATAPNITVPTITMEGDANGAPHPAPAAYAKKFSGKYQHRNLDGGIGHNLPQEAPAAFAQAVIDVTRL